MKAIMYHYVREDRPDLPYQRYLHVESFTRQLEWLGNEYGFASREDFYNAIEGIGTDSQGVVLTFDDGIADHYDYVYPILRRLGLWGIFYIPTAPYRTGIMLDVHRLHMLLGALGGENLVSSLRDFVEDSMLTHEHVRAFREITYREQDNDAATRDFKRALNYFISDEHRSAVIDAISRANSIGSIRSADEFYVTPEQLRIMQRGGMVIGSHSDSHPVMSKLAIETQRREIDLSLGYLATVLNHGVDSFCYPYGGFHTFTDSTEALLAAAGMRYAFNVEPRDIMAVDIQQRPMALPRYDCNLFPYGRAHFGPRAPDS